MKVTVVFDIGKTNKKCFLFDADYQIVHQEYIDLPEILDDDGFPADDLKAIETWITETLNNLGQKSKFQIETVNISTYGASFVHIDQNGKPVAPLYNYLKPYPPDLLKQFYSSYGPSPTLAKMTASPTLGMLNSGLQLYWLKHRKPEVFDQIRWSLHLPQYLSFRLSGLPVSEFTSVGCHTALWDYAKQDYHEWVYAEGLEWQLPPLVHTDLRVVKSDEGYGLGIGIHDSSAALIPYLRAEKKPFTLLSTGTWNISMNPFAEQSLTQRDLAADCLHFMQTSGKPVRAARLFLGHEFARLVQEVEAHFGVEPKSYQKIRFEHAIYFQVLEQDQTCFALESLPWKRKQPTVNQLQSFADFTTAYHQLVHELSTIQEHSLRLAIGKSPIEKVYIDGGFADNEVFVAMMTHRLPEYKVRTTQAPVGSALGAAMVLSGKPLTKKFLKKRYSMRKHRVHELQEKQNE